MAIHAIGESIQQPFGTTRAKNLKNYIALDIQQFRFILYSSYTQSRLKANEDEYILMGMVAYGDAIQVGKVLQTNGQRLFQT